MRAIPSEPRQASRVRYVGGPHPIIKRGDEAYIVETSGLRRIMIGFRGFQLHVSEHDVEPVADPDIS